MPGDRFIELATAEDRHVLEVLFGHAAEAVTVQDLSGRLLYANDTAAEMLGLKRSGDLIARTTEEILRRFEMIDRQGLPLAPEDLPGRKVMEGEPYAEAIVGYRVKGSQRARWSHVRSSPIKNDRREVVLVINFFADITAQVLRDEGQQVRAAVYEALGSSLDRKEVLDALAQALVPRMGTWCAVHLLDPGRRLEPAAAAFSDEARTPITVSMQGTISLDDDRLPARVASTGKPEVISQVTPDMIDAAESLSGPEVGKVLRGLDLGPVACVPMIVGRQLIGTLTLARTAGDTMFADADLDMLGAIADRAAATLDNARMYEQQSAIADTLQSVLTPRVLPTFPGLELAARYLPLSLIGHVGGDFYDVLRTPDGGYAVLVGDIAGKGIDAAAAVGLARYTLRSTIALDPSSDTVLGQINEALLAEDRMCTLAYLVLYPDGEGFRVKVMLAGHPPPIAITDEGHMFRVGRPCPPAGVLSALTPLEEEHRLGPGDTLVLYTDGFALPGLDPPESVELALQKCSRESPVRLLDQMLAMLLADSRARDDVALLALRVGAVS